MPASRFILGCEAKGFDPIVLLNDLTPEFERLFQ